MVVRLFGVTKAGNSICASVQGYRPYFYASAPAGFGEEHIANAIKMLNDQMKVLFIYLFHVFVSMILPSQSDH